MRRWLPPALIVAAVALPALYIFSGAARAYAAPPAPPPPARPVPDGHVDLTAAQPPVSAAPADAPPPPARAAPPADPARAEPAPPAPARADPPPADSAPALAAPAFEAAAKPGAAAPAATPVVASGLEEPAAGVFVAGAPLHAVNPSGANFDVASVNRPTRLARPAHGFPPRSLPAGHPGYWMLRELRQKTELHPRWPDHPEVHLQALKSYGPAYASIIISDKLKVVYVPVFKVGTTSMMWNIAFLENNPLVVSANISDPAVRDTVLHDFAGPAWRDHAIYGLSARRVRATLNDPSYLKFGFVRNPYHRVVSAYLDKVVKWPFSSREYQTQMYGLYGDADPALRAARNRTKPAFKEFLVAVERVLRAPRTPAHDLNSRDGYEDNRSRRDLHWRPQVELLHPDLIHFDFIGRFGRMDAGREHVLRWMYRHTDRRMPAARRRLHTTDPNDKVALFRLLREDPAARQLVLSAYKDDFERFGFSTDVPPVNEHE